ncbi:MAG: FMN-binding protein, partial [Clostridium perfringens]|nr:FMN-binding protein [Clostridium perfringens]
SEKFKGLTIEDNIKIVKTSPSSQGEIQGITGATISSNAVSSGINDAISFYKENVLGEDLSKEKILNLSKINLEGDITELTIELEEGIDKVSIVSNGEKEIGYAIEASEVGMYEEKPIKFAIGISTGGIITGVQIIDHKETAGLGDLIEDENFLNSFIGVSSLDKLSVKENTNEIDLSVYGEVVNVDSISGATKSSMAIIKGITNVINFYNNNLS